MIFKLTERDLLSKVIWHLLCKVMEIRYSFSTCSEEKQKVDWDEFSDWSKWIAEWGSQYHKTLRDRPVRAKTKPGEIYAQ